MRERRREFSLLRRLLSFLSWWSESLRLRHLCLRKSSSFISALMIWLWKRECVSLGLSEKGNRVLSSANPESLLLNIYYILFMKTMVY